MRRKILLILHKNNRAIYTMTRINNTEYHKNVYKKNKSMLCKCRSESLLLHPECIKTIVSKHSLAYILVKYPFLFEPRYDKTNKWVCAQRRLGSAWASAPSDQSLRCPHEECSGPKQPTERTAKTLIRLGRCPGWSESSLATESFCWFCYEAAQISFFI